MVIFQIFFSCNIGLMQGESLYPFLYAMYVNDIEIELIKQGCQSYELKMLNLYLLMYDDDTALFSENVHELQNMFNYNLQYFLHMCQKVIAKSLY
jgi:hypothetical protein